MARPDRKLSVTPETRKKWLQRHEENGESVLRIAERDIYDVRTVRKQLDLARQEKETRETRLMVLREAAQAHYGDLCKRAADIEAALGGRSSGVIGTEDRMCLALRQHLPRAPLWKYLGRWNDIQRDLEKTRSDYRTELNDEISKDNGLNMAFGGGERDISGMVEVFARQSEFWSQGSIGLEVEYAFKTEPAGEGLVNFRFGAYGIGTGPESLASAIKKALIVFRERLSDFEQYQNLKRLLKELNELIPDIQEELATITLRRVLPGRCKYCPI